MFIADTENHCIWYADMRRGRKRLWLVAGQPGASGNGDGLGSTARFNRPTVMDVNTRGTLLVVADTGNSRIRLISLEPIGEGGVVGRVTTLGGASAGVRDTALPPFTNPVSVSFDGVENVYVVDQSGPSIITRGVGRPIQRVELAQAGTFAAASSVTNSGTRTFVLDEGAPDDDSAVVVAQVGAPAIASVTPGSVPLAGGTTVVVSGRNFAPESLVTVGDAVASNIVVVSARELRFTAPEQRVPGARTLSVVTRGGAAQAVFGVASRPLVQLAADQIGTVAGGVFYTGDGGPAAALGVSVSPYGVAVDGVGNVFVADRDGHRVRRIDAATGVVTTAAGNGSFGGDGDGGPATAARLNLPQGVAVDGAGNLFIADTANHKVRRVDAITGVITTFAGTGVPGYSGENAVATGAQLLLPSGVAVDPDGNVFVLEPFNNVVRRVDAATGRIATYAGDGTAGGSAENVPALQARLRAPSAIAVDGGGNLFIADTANFRVRRVDASTKRIATVAGNGTNGATGDGGPATSAAVVPNGVAVDDTGALYITSDHRIRLVDADGTIDTVAGDGTGGFDGDGGPPASARFQSPRGIAVDGVGSYVFSDLGNGRLRRVDAAANVIRTFVGGQPLVGDGDTATKASLLLPRGVAVEDDGNTDLADELDIRVRRVDAGTGTIETVAGTGEPGGSGDGAPAIAARLDTPGGHALDEDGTLYVADSNNDRIRRVDTSGVIATVASAGLSFPQDVALGPDGMLYVADTGNNRVVRADPATGVVTPVAGTGDAGYMGDGGPATGARLNAPESVAVDANGDLYVADSANSVVRRVAASTGTISTIAGTGSRFYLGDGGPATSAGMWPRAVALDGRGNLFVADYENNAVRRIDLDAETITTVAGVGLAGYEGDDAAALRAKLRGPLDVTVGTANDLYVADTFNGAVRVVRDVGVGGVPSAPIILSASYSKPVLTISGVGFGGAQAVVRVNNVDVSARVRSNTGAVITLRGGPKKLNLRAGANEITVFANGTISNTVVLPR
jgi:sugar lactone lactonase YvrE